MTCIKNPLGRLEGETSGDEGTLQPSVHSQQTYFLKDVAVNVTLLDGKTSKQGSL